jgi:hypothetical protein
MSPSVGCRPMASRKSEIVFLLSVFGSLLRPQTVAEPSIALIEAADRITADGSMPPTHPHPEPDPWRTDVSHLYVGVDIGKHHHHIAVINEQGTLVTSREVPNEQLTYRR